MFKISYCNQMSIVQGDTATFTIEVDNYIFSEGDKAYFTVRKDTKESPIAIQKIITDSVSMLLLLFTPIDGGTTGNLILSSSVPKYISINNLLHKLFYFHLSF